MEQQKQPILYLFEDVAIYKPEDIDNLIDNLSEEQAKFMLIRAVQMPPYPRRHRVFAVPQPDSFFTRLVGS